MFVIWKRWNCFDLISILYFVFSFLYFQCWPECCPVLTNAVQVARLMMIRQKKTIYGKSAKSWDENCDSLSSSNFLSFTFPERLFSSARIDWISPIVISFKILCITMHNTLSYVKYTKSTQNTFIFGLKDHPKLLAKL